MKATLPLLSVLFAASLFACASAPEPAYRVIARHAGYEVREYDPYLVARTEVRGNFDKALNAGFRRLFDFISGDNTRREPVEMTAPVIQEPAGRPEKVSMTAPVLHEERSGIHVVSFIMPRKYTLQTIPRPNNPAVTIVEVPGRKAAVLRYSGYAGESKVRIKAAALLAMLERDGYRSAEPWLSARYDPPWTLPFLRRNEIIIYLP